jgi:hypothetical protein
MKGLKVLMSIGAVALLLATIDSFAQRGPGMMWRSSGGWGPGSPSNRMYDPKTVETIAGEVVSVSPITPNKGMDAGVHTMVNTGKETVSVHLGPSWYLENQDVKIEPKDKVEVKGPKLPSEANRPSSSWK